MLSFNKHCSSQQFQHLISAGDVFLGIFLKIFRTAMLKSKLHFHAVGTVEETDGLLEDLIGVLQI